MFIESLGTQFFMLKVVQSSRPRERYVEVIQSRDMNAFVFYESKDSNFYCESHPIIETLAPTLTTGQETL